MLKAWGVSFHVRCMFPPSFVRNEGYLRFVPTVEEEKKGISVRYAFDLTTCHLSFLLGMIVTISGNNTNTYNRRETMSG